MDYIFVATESIVGDKILKGPITGKDWLVTSKGNWIVDEFPRDDKFLHIEVYRYCFKTRSNVLTKIFLVEPSWAQMEELPSV